VGAVICDDFVMLGTTVPEPNGDGRVFVCSAGYSREMRQLLRIYPLARKDAPRRWSVNRVPLERNPRDSRHESWKIAGDRTPGSHSDINAQFSCVQSIKDGWHRKVALDDDRVWVGSIKEANDRKMSLALLRPRHVPKVDYEANQNSPDSPQLRLFDDGLPPAEGAMRFPYIPRLIFDDEGGEHRLMLRDWGCFELMRKRPEHTFHLADALSLGSNSCLLVGNMNQHRTSWLVISVLNVGADQLSLAV